MRYFLEAKRRTQTGVITIGARVGYDGPNTFTLEDVVKKLEIVNKKISSPLNGIITSGGELVGRSGDSSYRETVFKIALSTSPRSTVWNDSDFLTTLEKYATELGSDMKQERVYVEFNGITYVYKVEGEKNGSGNRG